MAASTVTVKGQTTVPQPIRDALQVQPGSQLQWHLMPDGSVIVRAKTHSITDLKGMLGSPKRRKVAVQDMNAWR